MILETFTGFGALVVLLFLAILAWFSFVADGDLSLMFVEQFGLPVESLRGQVAWVTGAASGIGEALSAHLAQSGVRLIISDINSEQLVRVRKECLEKSQLNSDDILVVAFDLTDELAREKAVQKVLSHYDQLDLVFHNAGRSQRGDYANISSDVDKAVFDVNCFGHVSLSRLVLPHFIKNGRGHFVVTSSILGKLAIPRASVYVASKHAIIGYFESLRIEYYQAGVDVTIICPGAVFSGIYDQAFSEKAGQFHTGGMQATDRRMKACRCARLMALAAANRLEEAWPCLQPALLGAYACQYAPTLFKRVAKRLLNSENIDALRDGRKTLLCKQNKK